MALCATSSGSHSRHVRMLFTGAGWRNTRCGMSATCVPEAIGDLSSQRLASSSLVHADHWFTRVMEMEIGQAETVIIRGGWAAGADVNNDSLRTRKVAQLQASCSWI